MGRPYTTNDQREIAVTLLANAIRKDAHLRARASNAKEHGNPLATVTAGRRSESSRRYVEGMRDLMRVLFADGHDAADACLEQAYAQAIGVDVPPTPSGNGTPLQ